MNTDLINKAKNDFEKDFLKLMNNAVLRNLQKLSENIGTLNLQQQKKKKLVSKPNYHTNFFSGNLLAVYFGLSI